MQRCKDCLTRQKSDIQLYAICVSDSKTQTGWEQKNASNNMTDNVALNNRQTRF